MPFNFWRRVVTKTKSKIKLWFQHNPTPTTASSSDLTAQISASEEPSYGPRGTPPLAPVSTVGMNLEPALVADGAASRSPSTLGLDVEVVPPAIAGTTAGTVATDPSAPKNEASVVSLSPSEEAPGPAQSATRRTLTPWEQALSRLQPESREGIDFQKDGKVDLLREFIRETTKKKRECEDGRWGYIDDNGKKVFYADILLTQLNRYVAIGDIALQHHPDIVALAWAGFRLLLQVATADVEDLRLIFESLEYLVRVLCRCDIYEKLYFEQELEAAKLLNDSLVDLYVSILEYLCCARRKLSDHTASRILKSIFSDLGQLFRKIQDCEKDVGNDADTAEKEAARIESFAQEGRTKALKRLLAEIQEPILKIERTVADIYAFVEKEIRCKILMWLSDVPFADHHSFFQARRHEDTGDWLLKNGKFLNWRSSSSSSSFWLRGDAGAGKTMLASKIVDEFEPQTKRHALAYFYCNYREEARRDPASIMRALIKQLCLAAPGESLPKPVLSIYQEREKKGHIFGPLNLDESKNLIVGLSAGFLQTTIVIDALDESNRSTRRDLLHALKQIVVSANHVKIFVTSRNDGDIRKTLVDFSNHYIDATDNTKDINIYINSEVGRCFSEGLLPNEGDYAALKNEIISTLSGGAHGMFMWVHFQILAICKEHTPGNIRKALKSLPKDLNETYTRIIEKVNSQSEGTSNTAKRVLRWLLYATELNSPTMISEFLLVKPGEATLDTDRWTQSQILDICQNLVVYDKKLDVLRFAHFSVQEFLLHHPEFSHEEKASTSTIAAEICLTVLTYHHSEVQICPTPALLDYATFNWAAQVRLSGVGSSTLKELLENFLKPSVAHYKAWALGVAQGVPDLRGSNSEVISPLWVACYYQLYDIFRSFLDSGMAPDCYNHQMRTPLSWAAGSGYEEVVQVLLEKDGVDVNSKDKDGWPALLWAIKGGHEKVVQMLLEKDGVDVNSKNGKSLTALQLAAREGHEEVVQILLEKDGVDVNSRGEEGLTALSTAAREGHEKVVQILLEKDGVDVNSKGRSGWTALSIAARGGHEKVVQMLLKKGGVGVNSKDGGGWTALLIAAREGHGKVVRMLLKKDGVDVNSKDGKGLTALQLAAREGHEKVVRMLLKKDGVDVNSKDGKGLTALSLATKIGHEKVVQVLLEKDGLDLNYKKGDGWTALSIAALNGREKIVQMLLEKDGLDLNSKNKNGQTALSIAASRGKAGVVQILLEKSGVDLNSKDNDGWTALALATSGGHRKVVQMLEKALGTSGAAKKVQRSIRLPKPDV